MNIKRAYHRLLSQAELHESLRPIAEAIELTIFAYLSGCLDECNTDHDLSGAIEAGRQLREEKKVDYGQGSRRIYRELFYKDQEPPGPELLN